MANNAATGSGSRAPERTRGRTACSTRSRQAQRFDPDGAYVRRYVPELAGIEGCAVHEPWKLGLLAPADYPGRLVEHEHAAAAFLARRR